MYISIFLQCVFALLHCVHEKKKKKKKLSTLSGNVKEGTFDPKNV